MKIHYIDGELGSYFSLHPSKAIPFYVLFVGLCNTGRHLLRLPIRPIWHSSRAALCPGNLLDSITSPNQLFNLMYEQKKVVLPYSNTYTVGIYSPGNAFVV